MLVRDNEQATISSSWFAGFLEGEGNFVAPKNVNQNGRIRITNTDLDLIEACESFLDNNKICYYTQKDAIRKDKRKQTCYTVYIKNSMRDEFYPYCEKLYKIIGDKVECRIDEYKKLLEIESSTTTRVPSIDLDWLIGIWEAEGTMCFTRTMEGNTYQVLVL